MVLQTWLTSILVASSGASCLYLFIASVKQKSIMLLVFALGLLSFTASKSLYFFEDEIFDYLFYRDYIAVIGITFILIGLFILIRDSKPVFARFPSQFTLLPFIIIPFYPMLFDTLVLRDLISMIFQAGSLLVAFLILFMNQYKERQHGMIIVGSLCLAAVFFMRWVFNTADDFNWIWQILLSLGIIVSTIGFHRLTTENTNTLAST